MKGNIFIKRPVMAISISVLILAISLLCGPRIIGLFVDGGSVFTLTWDGLKLSRGEPAIPTRVVPPKP